MQQPPPYQPPPYQPPPPGGFGAPGAAPAMQPMLVDRLRSPMLLLITASVIAIVRSLTNTVVWMLAARSGGYSPYRFTIPLMILLSVLVGGFLIGACAGIVSQKRPGHPLALGAAITSGVGILLSVSNVFAGAFGGMGVVPILSSLIGATALVLLSLCLRAIGRSRERPVDAFAFTIIGLAAVSVLFMIAVRLGVHLGEVSRYVSLLIAIGEYGALMLIAQRLMSYVPPAELVMGDPSAYRGPQGAYPMPEGTMEGSLALGFLAGFFGGCIGLGLVLMIAKGRATKRGAGIGFACQTVVGIGLRAVAR